MKKVFCILKNIVVWLIVLFTIAIMIFTVISVTTFDNNDRSFFGYKLYIVRTDSMSKTDFSAGDLIFVKETDPSTLKEGDIITFISQDSNSFGETVTHKIRTLTTDEKGKPGFVTYGTTTNTDDGAIVTYSYVLGKYKGNIPFLGTFFNFLRSTLGYVICIFIPFMLVIIYESVKFFSLLRKYKKEQIEALQAERDKIEAEKAETAKMLAEIKALKSELDQQKNTSASEEKATVSVNENAEENV